MPEGVPATGAYMIAAYIVTAFLTSIALSIASSRHLMKILLAKLRTRRM